MKTSTHQVNGQNGFKTKNSNLSAKSLKKSGWNWDGKPQAIVWD